MKIKHIYMVAALALTGLAITACSDEKLSSESVFNVQEETPNEFDLWIKKSIKSFLEQQVMNSSV